YVPGKIAIITGSGLYGVGSGVGNGAGGVVGGVNRVRIQAPVVVERLAVGDKGQRQVFGFAIATGEGKADIRASLPAFQQAGMQAFFIKRLLVFTAKFLHAGKRLCHRASRSCHSNVAVRSSDISLDGLTIAERNVQRLAGCDLLDGRPVEL